MSETSERLSVSAIAEMTDTSEKTLRAYLRRNFKRQDERKGSRWGDAKQGFILTKTQTEKLVEHFTSSTDESETA